MEGKASREGHERKRKRANSTHQSQLILRFSVADVITRRSNMFETGTCSLERNEKKSRPDRKERKKVRLLLGTSWMFSFLSKFFLFISFCILLLISRSFIFGQNLSRFFQT